MPGTNRFSKPEMSITNYIRTIPDFPEEGILFRDLTTLFNDSDGFALAIDQFTEAFADLQVAHVAGIEARGFILGGALAYRLGAGFIPVRKKGKLPAETIERSYDLEYGSATIEVHTDSLTAGDRVLVVDDLIATGGTALAAVELMTQLEATTVALAAIVDLPDLGGSGRLRSAGVDVHALCTFPGH